MSDLIYKFRDWKDLNHKRILTDREIYFASQLDFNDPFDSKIIPRYDMLTKKQKDLVIRNLLKHDHPEWNDKKINVEIAKFLKEDIFTKEIIQGNAEKVMDSVLKSVGIFTTTLTKKNILLWSHYADSHKGFCVGFKKNLLVDNINQSWKIIKNSSLSNPVKYLKFYPNILPTNDIDLYEFIERPLFSKFLNWKDEEEFRIVLLSEGRTAFRVKVETIEEINLGCNIDPSEKKEIMEVIKEKLPKAKVYQAKKVYMDFALDFEQIY